MINYSLELGSNNSLEELNFPPRGTEDTETKTEGHLASLVGSSMYFTGFEIPKVSIEEG